MHPVRRRKKRPNYGVRTVEVSRGENGFGFTISGQQPCILSCIVAGSPAERAGLRPGDYLVAVNGQSVSKIPHDDVVRLIGSSFGLLKLQIAENYYSDSSDEDVISPTRPKPKHPHKPRSNNVVQQRSETTSTQQTRAAKVVRDLRTGAMFVEQQLEVVSIPEAATVRTACKSATVLQRWDPPVPLGLPQPPPRLYLSPQPEKPLQLDHVEYRALVGYLGTIEMPRELLPGSRLQVVRGCIKRLRAEKRAHTLVLMSIRTRSLILTNCHQSTLAEYPADRVTFCGVGSDDQHRFFGLVTAVTRSIDEDDNGETVPSSSCHVFAVELRLHGCHADHAAKAEAFKLCCSEDATLGTCPEFPASSDPVVAAVKVLYSRRRDESGNLNEEPILANSPQPSNASSTVTTTSSNSDSGIGFRDECGGNQSDRILMVDIQNQRLHIQQMVSNNHDSQELYQCAMNPPKSCKYDFAIPVSVNRSKRCVVDGCSSRLTVRAMPDPISNLSGTLAVSSRSRSPLNSTSSEGESHNSKSCAKMYSDKTSGNGSNCNVNYRPNSSNMLSHISTRSNDDMSISSETNKSEDLSSRSCQTKSYRELASKALPALHFSTRFYERSDISNFNCSAFPRLRSDNSRSTEAMSIDSSQSQDPLMSYKLSPKVFGLSRPVTTQSLEDLKPNGMCLLMDGEEEVPPMNLSSTRGQQWGSLQELRSFVANCFQASPAAEHMNRPQLKKWSNSSVICKTYVRQQNPQRPHSLTYRRASDDDMLRQHPEQQTSIEPEESQKGVGSWSASFEKLLEDPAGLHTFAEFLKKEFSHENIYFWVACEKYRELSAEEERKADAKAIFDRHLCLGALEPVNVDSHARQTTQDGLGEASKTLFLQAQKQIFNLMKFDSYPRFIKSDLYKECLLRHISGQQLPFPGGAQLDTGLQLHANTSNGLKDHSKLKKSRSDAEDHRRKSLLPWHRKNRSKSKDRGESEYQKLRTKCSAEDTVSVRSDVTSSRSSLASWDLALRGSFSRRSLVPGEVENTLCRVILPDDATTVVQTRSHETVRDLVLRLLDKRGLNYSGFQVFTQDSSKPVSLDAESSVLSGQEARVERRVVFRLDLPNRKTVGVKSKPTKTLAEVLRPILHKYGYKLDLITLCLMSENEVLELSLPVVAVDNQRLQVLTRSGEGWKSEPSHSSSVVHAKLKAGPTLDEITNRVFEELLQCKADGTRTASDQNSVRSEDWGSEHSSGIFGRFLRRDSALHEKARESRMKSKKTAAASKLLLDETDTRSTPSSSRPKPLLVSKWKAGGVKTLQGRSESDLSPDLYEGLKRAQRSRLEDQRGTEINFELPDFLKDKENAPQTGKKFRKLRKADGDNSDLPQAMSSSHESLTPASSSGKQNVAPPFLDPSFRDGIVPSRKTEQLFLAEPHFTSTPTSKNNSARSGNSTSSNSMDETVVDGRHLDSTLTYEPVGATSPQRPASDPPPLPPKPKHLPIKAALWNNVSSIPNQPPTFRVPVEITNNNARFLRPNEVKRDPKVCRGRRAVYLDQPSSSFV